ncbi:MAG: molybdate ABC transporter substrate-binding protein [Desulfobacterales bacterium]
MKKLGRRCLITVLLCLAVPLIAFAESPNDITVSAAISLKNAFEEIGRLYDSKYGTKCILNFGASGDLTKQIAGGAPVDVFASAAQKDMDDAEKQGLIVAGTRADFAANSVVLIVPAGAKISLKSFEGLSAAEIKKIAVGNPKTVPAGRYAEEVFGFYQMLSSLKDKFIYTENVRQVLDYVVRGEVDAGVVYATDAATRSKEIRIIAIAPEASHKPVICPIAVVKRSKSEADAKAFVSLALSPEGKKILQKYGFK